MAVQQPSEQEVPGEADEWHIIDTDFHAGPSADVEPLLPYIESDVVVDKLETANPLSTPGGIIPAYGSEQTASYHAHGAASDGEDVREIMHQFSLDEVIISPGMNTLPGSQYPVIKTAICKALNDYLLDAVVDGEDDITMHMALPIWDPEACVEELDRIGDEKDVVAGYGWYGPYTSMLGEPQYDQVYERLIELDLPLAIHVGGGTTPPVNLVGRSMRTRTEALGWLNTFYGVADVINMIVTGVFDKYPELDIICQETGVTWLPFVANRINEIYYTQPEDIRITERMFELGKEYLDQDPGEYLFSDVRYSTQPIALPDREPEAMLRMCRAEQTFMYSSDWPHHTLDPVTWVFTRVSDDDLRKQILNESARECYGL